MIASKGLSEDSYLGILKLVACINFSSEDPQPLMQTIFDLEVESEDSPIAINISEGLMHLLNEVGYPHHESPEALSYLRMSCDLIAFPNSKPYFYLNDAKILLDLIIRELGNVSDSCLELREWYLSLLMALINNPHYESIQSYRTLDISGILEHINLDSKASCLHEKSSEILTVLKQW